MQVAAAVPSDGERADPEMGSYICIDFDKPKSITKLQHLG